MTQCSANTSVSGEDTGVHSSPMKNHLVEQAQYWFTSLQQIRVSHSSISQLTVVFALSESWHKAVALLALRWQLYQPGYVLDYLEKLIREGICLPFWKHECKDVVHSELTAPCVVASSSTCAKQSSCTVFDVISQFWWSGFCFYGVQHCWVCE